MTEYDYALQIIEKLMNKVEKEGLGPSGYTGLNNLIDKLVPFSSAVKVKEAVYTILFDPELNFDIYLLGSVSKIPPSFFEGLRQLPIERIPAHITEIGGAAFRNVGLVMPYNQKIIIPSNVMRIQPRAFENCGCAIYFEGIPKSIACGAFIYARNNIYIPGKTQEDFDKWFRSFKALTPAGRIQDFYHDVISADTGQIVLRGIQRN